MVITKLTIYILCSFVAVFAIGMKVIAPHEGNFFRSVVALTISRWFNLALCNGALALLLAIFWTTIRIFFEKLHPLESAHLQEKFLVFAAESVLGVAMVRGTVSVTDATLFVCTCAVTMVHNVLVKRMNMLEESAMPVTKRRIFSVSLLSALLFFFDVGVILWLGSMVWGSLLGSSSSSHMMASAGRSTGIILLLLLEWSLNATASVTATTKLALMAFSARFPSEITNSVRFYVEIVCELGKCILYVAFGGALLHQSTMPLHLVREILSNVKRIAVLIRDFVQHRKRMKWIEQVAIPTDAQLNEDRFCNICRDEVTNPTTSRILPCSHLFHVDCLAKWLERNRDCPYCQRDVEVMINDFIAAQKRNEAVSAVIAAVQQQAAGDGGNNNEQQQQQQPPQQPMTTRTTVAKTNDGRTIEVTAEIILNNNEVHENIQNPADGGGGSATAAAAAARRAAVAGAADSTAHLDEAVLKHLYEQYRTVAKAQQEQKQRRAERASATAASAGDDDAVKPSPSSSSGAAAAATSTNSHPASADDPLRDLDKDATAAAAPRPVSRSTMDPASEARARFFSERYSKSKDTGAAPAAAAAFAEPSSLADLAQNENLATSQRSLAVTDTSSTRSKPFIISDDDDTSTDDDNEERSGGAGATANTRAADDMLFHVAPSPSGGSSSRQGSPNPDAADAATGTIAAYRRYEASIERAKKQLKRELDEVAKSLSPKR